MASDGADGAGGAAKAGGAEPLGDPTTLEVGVVTKPHGLRGEVRVSLHWADSTSLFDVDSVDLVDLTGSSSSWKIASRRRANKFLLVRFDGLDDCDAADRLRGCKVRIPRAALPALEAGEYFLQDLLGMTVEAPDGVLGTVVAVSPYPTVDAVTIELTDGGHVEQILEPQWVEQVDVAGRRLVLSSRDGLVE